MRNLLLLNGRLSLVSKVFLLTTFILCPFFMNAQDLLKENFEYNVAGLVGQGGWKEQAAGTPGLMVADTALTYPGYQDVATGKAVKLEDAGQDAYKEFEEKTIGTVYYSALVYITKAQSNTIGEYFLHFSEGGGGTAGLSGRLFARTSPNGKLQFAVTRTNVAASAEFASAEFDFNKTHLIVVKYTLKGNGSGAKDDEVALFVNPAIGGTEPEPVLKGTNTSSYNPGKIGGINIRQGAKGKTPLGYVDALRVATSWQGLFGGASVSGPELTLSPKSAVFGEVYGGDTYEKTINIKGKNLKGDITVGGMGTGELKASAAIITKEEAEADGGYDLTLTLTPANVENSTDSVLFNSEGMSKVRLNSFWNTYLFTEAPDLKTLRSKDATDEWTKYKVTGEAVISHIYKDGTNTYYYLQDGERGITVFDRFKIITTEYNEGDKLKNFCGTLSLSFGSLSLVPLRDFGAPVSSGNTVVPLSVTLTQLKANPKDYESRLIRTEVEFTGVAGAQETPLFVEGVNPDITDGTTTAKMRVFKSADYIGSAIPAKAILVGIPTSGAGNLVAPRNLKDITASTGNDGNLFQNSGFEEWTGSAMFGYNPAEWESTMGTTFQESTTKLAGEYALRIKTDKLDAKLEQEVRWEAPQAFIPGQKYELTIHYYTLKSQAGNDIALKSYWRAGGTTELTHDSDVLNNGSFFTSVGKWETKTVQTTVPEGANSFYFALGIPKGGTEVVFDSFSFIKMASTEPSLAVMPDKIAKMNTNINVAVNSAKVMVYTENLPAAVSLTVTGKNAAYFTPSVTSIPVSQNVTELTIEYKPVTAGEHTATLTLECPGASALSKTISLKGYATDPANPPSITINETGPIAFTAKVGENQEKEILVSSKNLTDYLYARVMGDSQGQFIISNTLLPGNVDNASLKIKFQPKQEGSFNERVAVYCKTDTVFVTLQGTATAGSGEEPEGDKFPLDITNPRVLLNEHFDAVTHNKVLKLDGWKSIAVQNNRAWWGYNFKNDAGDVIESTAKVTAYSSTATTSQAHEMWLVTPPLDFKKAAKKIFTFRVMGDLLLEGQDASLEVCYMDMEDGELYTSPIEIQMPSVPDDNKDWREYHIDLEGQNLADVFFIGFHFKGMGGKVNSAVYYIDDVSYGRTDLPSITPSKTTLELETFQGITIESERIDVRTANLTMPVTLTVGGPNASKFKTSVATLPASGGSFTVSFESDEIGVHQAYVRASSRGAADIYIPVSINNKSITGIERITFDVETEVSVFDYTGREVLRKTICGTADQLAKELADGIYILHTGKGNFKLVVNNR